ncbi:S-layer family protein [Anaerospora hongkongensis]|uniref:S-layer family protein n=1 Tax=Anaerospora hongkongensis TaxID=244830 RepID=A0A4R1Q2X6_9FIRM|nr:S-layer homology domain-containing protein [Anaerospora hongkongensis]TCL38858.1 S-layer family protein [Anaerospora hongkongensis]
MKKTLCILLVLVIVLSITGIAFAGPFADVPAKHWSYDAISKLAKAGIIDGYSDGTFRGDKTITRYEMAIIVGKAMERSDKADAANKTLIDELANEFETELKNLGVRVGKLENYNKSNLKVRFDSLFIMAKDNPPDGAPKINGNDAWRWRNRMYFTGDINSKTSYTARLVTSLNIAGATTSSSSLGTATQFDRFFFTTKNLLGFDEVRWGRFNFSELGSFVAYKSGSNDGVTFSKKLGDDATFKFGAFIASPEPAAVGNFSGDAQEVQYAVLQKKLSDETTVGGMFLNNNRFVRQSSSPFNYGYDDTQLYNLYLSHKLGKWTLAGEYVSTSVHNGVGAVKEHPKAYALQITNGIYNPGKIYPSQDVVVKYDKPHTDALVISYRYTEMGAIPNGLGTLRSMWIASPTYKLNGNALDGSDNTKGWLFSYQYVLAKNIVANIDYQDLKFVNSGAPEDKILYTMIHVKL